MGQYYYVDVRLKVSDDNAFIAVTRKLLANENVNADCLKKFDDTSVLGCVRFMLAAEFQGQFRSEEDEDGFIEYSNDFHATYSWSSLLWDWWDVIKPYIEYESSIHVQEDEGSWTLEK